MGLTSAFMAQNRSERTKELESIDPSIQAIGYSNTFYKHNSYNDFSETNFDDMRRLGIVATSFTGNYNFWHY